MFCPNCGTQNPDTATTCSKCGFNLKGAAAPKFKGTMLMMNAPPGGPRPAGAPAPNQPGAAPPPGAPPAGMPGGPPVGPQPGAGRAAMKGTMLGVAPPSPGAPTPGAPLPPGGLPGGPPPQAGGMPGPGAAGGGFPPAAGGAQRPPAGGGYGGGPVNPLGGTMVADPGSMGMNPGYGQQPPPGQAPAHGPYGPPPGHPPAGQPPAYGGAPPPPPAFGAPEGGYGGAPGGHAPGFAPNPYGSPNAPVDGAPHFGMQPMGGMGPGAAPIVPTGAAAMGQRGAHGPVGNLRNPIVVTLLGFICFPYLAFVMWSTVNELKAFTQREDINPILFFVPILNILLFWQLPEKVLEAKQRAGIANPQVVHPVLYLLLWPYFFTTDLNEIFQAAGAQPPPA